MAVLEGIVKSLPRLDDSQTAIGSQRETLNAWTLRSVGDEAAVFLALALLVPDYGVANVLFVPLVLLCMAGAGNYRRRLSLSVLDEAPRLLLPVAAALLVMGMTSPVVDLPNSLFTQAAATAAFLLVGRSLSYAAIRQSRATGRLVEPTIIVGAGAIGIELYRLLVEHKHYGLAPVGILDDVPADGAIPLLGTVRQLEWMVAEHDVRRVIVAFGPTGEQDLIATLRAAALLDVEVHVVPRFFELGLAPAGPDIEQIWGIPVYRVRRAALRAAAWHVKRFSDVVVSALMLVLLAPLLGALALAVRLGSPGPILFRQHRIGQHGRIIEVLKFRTMDVNADSDTTWSVIDDPRQGFVGRWLRRLSLDELPQLWNVLRGDMSLIGPRPERPHFVREFSAQVMRYNDRHRLPVGLTGLAQVHGLRGDTSIEERARFDNSYIEHWSPWLDLKIMLRTGASVLRDAVHATRPHPEPEDVLHLGEFPDQIAGR